jgi:hypothetical protein
MGSKKSGGTKRGGGSLLSRVTSFGRNALGNIRTGLRGAASRVARVFRGR